ncbi:unnamed protein product [Alternaria sp. RS040]
MPQDMPPTGGYSPVQYKRNLPVRGFRPAAYLFGTAALMTYGFWRVGQGIREHNELAREKMWARIHLIPALQAEEDRDQVRRHLADKAREKELLGTETKVYNSDRYVLEDMASHGFASTAPIRTNSPPHTSGNVIPSQIDDEDWEIVNPHEAGVSYYDRVTLLLGPRQETCHQILLVDIPKFSKLLNKLKMLAPPRRTIHLSFIDLSMIKSYLSSQSISADVMAIEFSWMNIIKLAATADMFQDTVIEDRALAALTQKAIIAVSPSNAVSLFKEEDFAFASTYHTETGKGDKLIKTLRDIQQMDERESDIPVMKLPKAGDVRPKSKPEEVKQKVSDTKYSKSVLKDKEFSAAKKEGDDRVHPIRQPTVPPSIEALKRGDAKNFVWR